MQPLIRDYNKVGSTAIAVFVHAEKLLVFREM